MSNGSEEIIKTVATEDKSIPLINNDDEIFIFDDQALDSLTNELERTKLMLSFIENHELYRFISWGDKRKKNLRDSLTLENEITHSEMNVYHDASEFILSNKKYDTLFANFLTEYITLAMANGEMDVIIKDLVETLKDAYRAVALTPETVRVKSSKEFLNSINTKINLVETFSKLTRKEPITRKID